MTKHQISGWCFSSWSGCSKRIGRRMRTRGCGAPSRRSPASRSTCGFARSAVTPHARDALEIYAARVEQLAESGGNLAKLVLRMTVLRSASEQAAYLAALKARFGRKRNFMKLLG